MKYKETVWVNNDIPLVDFENVAIFKDKYPPSNEANGIRLSHPKGTHLYKISS